MKGGGDGEGLRGRIDVKGGQGGGGGKIIKNKNTLILLIFDLLRSIHPTSRRVSEQLTKITRSSPLLNHMLIILFPIWAGIKSIWNN